MNILALNAGSSSLKAACFAFDDEGARHAPNEVWRSHASWLALPGQVEIRSETKQGETSRNEAEAHSVKDVFRLVLDPATTGVPLDRIAGVGHRVVHGGQRFRESTVLTADVKSEIARLAELAPSHNQIELEGIEAAGRVFPKVAQVAVFDTSFHSSLPACAYVYPGPYSWLEQGIRRYGFHGINHSYVAFRAAQMLGRDPNSISLISCHLGNGCSMAAIRDGRSVDTTMGFTPLDGLMMGSRSGSLDPGILIYLLRRGTLTVDQLDRILNQQSGLRGISGRSADMRDVLAAVARGESRAQLALDIYVHRIRSYLGALRTSLSKLDAVVFTAGVGENCAAVRSAVCADLGFLGLELDPRKNDTAIPDANVSADGSAVQILVVRAQEEWEIARECLNAKENYDSQSTQ